MTVYATLGTRDLDKAAALYHALAAEMGVGRMMEWPGAIAWSAPGGAPASD